MTDSTSLVKPEKRYSKLESWKRRLSLIAALAYGVSLFVGGFSWITFGLFISTMLIAFLFPSPQTGYEMLTGQKTRLFRESDERKMLDGTSDHTDPE